MRMVGIPVPTKGRTHAAIEGALRSLIDQVLPGAASHLKTVSFEEEGEARLTFSDERVRDALVLRRYREERTWGDNNICGYTPSFHKIRTPMEVAGDFLMTFLCDFVKRARPNTETSKRTARRSVVVKQDLC